MTLISEDEGRLTTSLVGMPFGGRRTAEVVVAILLSGGMAAAGAQLSPPAIPVRAEGRSTLPISPAEAAHHVALQEGKLRAGVSFRATRYPIDSMHRAVAQTGSEWLQRLRASPVQGIQLDPHGHVAIAAQRETEARAQIAARIGTPGLSLGDKGFTYLTAIDAFTSVYYPERLPIAEEYLKQLDALGDSAAYWQFQARRPLVDTYYLLGRSVDVIRHGVRAIQLIPVMPFFDRGVLFPYYGGDGELYAAAVDALTGQPNGRQRIEALNTMLKEAILPPPALVALDPEFADRGVGYGHQLRSLIEVGSRIGTRGDPLVSNYWINRGPTRDSAVMPVDDGKIRVIEIAGYG